MDALTERAWFDLHGITLAVQTDDPELVPMLQARIAPLRAEGPGPGVCVTFRYRVRPSEAPPPTEGTTGRPIYDLPDGHVLYDDEADVLSVDWGGVAMVVDLATDTIDARAATNGIRERWLVSHTFLTLALMEVLKRHGRYALHAAGGSVDDGRVVIVSGTSGAGKSTLSMVLARSGMGYLGDDTMWVTDGPDGLEILGLPEEADVADLTATLLPELSFLDGRPKPPGAAKHRLLADEVWGAELVLRGRPGVLVFPHVSEDDVSVVTPIGPEEALMELLPNLLLTSASRSQEQLDVLGRLARECPAVRLATGRDLERVPSLIRAHL